MAGIAEGEYQKALEESDKKGKNGLNKIVSNTILIIIVILVRMTPAILTEK